MFQHEKHEGVEKMKIAEWAKQLPLLEQIYRGPQNWIDSVESAQKAFSKEGRTVVCMDEGTSHLSMDSKLCVAGSGILMFPELSWEKRLEEVAALFIQNGAKEITSHEGCGAAKLAASQQGWEGNSDDLGKKWAQALQIEVNRQLQVQGNDEHKHISAAEMMRPAEFHTAGNVWFVASKRRFNPDKLGNKAPLGFVVDCGLVGNSQYSLTELAVAIKIAFGDHGFGNLFSETKPFVVTVIADGDEELRNTVAMVNESLLAQEEAVRNKILVDGFIAPKETHHFVRRQNPSEVRV